jgi:hypothetical protein
MNEVKIAAIERGLMAIRKRKTGPIIIMEARTGKSFGTFSDTEEAMKALLKIDPLPVEAPPEAVGWHADVEYIELPRRCPNGWGADCLCLDTTAIYICAAPPCRLQAGCRGICRVHYSQLRVFGNLTEFAVRKTAKLAELGEFDLEHLPNNARVTALKNYNQTAIATTTLTAGEINLATSGVLGMNIKWTGREYILVDKDGRVLDRITSKEELFAEEEEEIFEEDESDIIEE